jgi:CBS domain containing-hemolysin-like protein
MGDALTLVFGLVLLTFQFFFVLAEFALVRLRASRVEGLIEAGDQRAVLVQRIQGNMDAYLSVVQVGITGATLGIGIIIEDGIAKPIEHLLGSTGGAVLDVLSHAVGFLIATFIVILTSELLPKSIAIRYAEQAALFSARPMVVCYYLFYPLLWLLTRSNTLLLRLLRLNRGTDEQPHSEDELRLILDQSQEHGLMSFRRLLFMENVFEIGELTVRDAMRPRAQVRCLHADLHWKDTLEFLATWPYSRFPLIDQDPEQPIGFVHVKDLFYRRYFYRAQMGDPMDLRQVARPLPAFLATMSLETVLAEMQRRRVQIGTVVDANGKWIGVITLEDILEELVGTIQDEFESEEPLLLSDHLTEGRVVLDIEAANLAEALRLSFARVPTAELPLERDVIVKAVMERERLAGTYLGKGIALPHARLNGIEKASLIVVRSRTGIPVEGTGERATLLFILLTPAGQPRVHQRLQAKIAGILENSDYVQDHLQEAETQAEVVEILRTGEQTTLD